MPCTPWRRMSSAIPNASRHGGLLLDDLEEPVVLDHDQRVDAVAQVLDPDLRLLGAAPPLEAERPGDDADGQRLELAPELGDDRRGARAGAAALAGGDEDHVRALERLLQLVAASRAPRRGRRPDRRRRRDRASPSSRCGSSRRRRSSGSACASVLTAMNSTPLRPDSTMRLTAFVPPPPTPTTLITAR